MSSKARVNWRRRKNRAAKNERKRLDAWAARVRNDLGTPRSEVWFFIGNTSNGQKVFLSATEPAESAKLAVKLPEPMTFFQASDYISAHEELEKKAHKDLWAMFVFQERQEEEEEWDPVRAEMREEVARFYDSSDKDV